MIITTIQLACRYVIASLCSACRPSEDLDAGEATFLNSSGNAMHSMSCLDPTSGYFEPLLDGDRLQDASSPDAVEDPIGIQNTVTDGDAVAFSERAVPSPITNIIKVGRQSRYLISYRDCDVDSYFSLFSYASMQSLPQPPMNDGSCKDPSTDILDSFDLARMERSAQFLSSLLLPLSTAAVSEDGDGVSAAQVDDADMEVIRDRLTMLLGRKVCVNPNFVIVYCIVIMISHTIFFIVAGSGERN